MQKHLSESSIIYKSFSDLLYQESNANGIDWLLYLWVKIRSLLCKETIAELRCHQILKSRALKEPQMFQHFCSSRLCTMRKYENFKRSAFFLGKKSINIQNLYFKLCDMHSQWKPWHITVCLCLYALLVSNLMCRALITAPPSYPRLHLRLGHS